MTSAAFLGLPFIPVSTIPGALAGGSGGLRRAVDESWVLLAQWGIIRMFEMTPRQLLRWGVGCAAVGNLVVALAPDYSTVVAGYAITSLGFTSTASA